ncbi:MAG TPA: EamA family transporter [Silvibacterium sp.]|nr:EamA family transporter [Silvibacterium sp.]
MLKWLLIVLTVVSGSCGDILCAKGMSIGGELSYSGRSGAARALRYIVTRRLVILGIFFDAIGFFSLLALFTVAQLSVAVPATALGFILDAVGARVFLHEHVHWKRWVGVVFVAVGVVLAVRPDHHHKAAKPKTGTVAVQPQHR